MKERLATAAKRKLTCLAVLTLAGALVTSTAVAGRYEHEPRLVGQYLLADDDLDLAGGALLYSDCTQDGSLIGGSIPIGGPPPEASLAVLKFLPTIWVNDPDPATEPYAQWPVPDALLDVPRLFVCFDVESVDGTGPQFGEFCDWLPRRQKRPLEIDFDGDEDRDLLVTVQYRGGPKRCADGSPP